MNTPKYKNREDAIHETWLSKFPRKIADFAFIRARIQQDEPNVVWLKGVNDEEYPPQKKSFRLLNYFHKNLNYDWFVRMDWVFNSIYMPWNSWRQNWLKLLYTLCKDDDSYLNVEKLTMFLKTLDPNEPMMIGSAGYGRDNEDFVELGMSYCMGGTGVIFSRRLIFDLQPFLSICIKNLYTEHEDMLWIELTDLIPLSDSCRNQSKQTIATFLSM